MAVTIRFDKVGLLLSLKMPPPLASVPLPLAFPAVMVKPSSTAELLAPLPVTT